LEQYIQLENSVMTMWQDQVTATCFMYVGITFLFCLLLCYWYHRSKNLPPGPRGLPIVGTVPFAGKFLARTLRKWAAVYGPIMTVRFGKRDVITLNDYQSVNEVSLICACAIRLGRGYVITNLLCRALSRR